MFAQALVLSHPLHSMTGSNCTRERASGAFRGFADNLLEDLPVGCA